MPLRRSLDRLGVPEAGRRVDLPGRQRGDRVEADRDFVDRGRVAAVGADLGVDHGCVGGEAGDPDRVAVEVAGLRTGPSRRARTAASGRCTIGIRPTSSSPFSSAIPRSWMSRIAKSVRPAASSFGASVDSPGDLDVEVDPGVPVEASACAA